MVKQSKFQKGHAKVGGREKGTPNKRTALFKDQLTDALSIAGEIRADEFDAATKKKLQPYLEKAQGDYSVAYLVWAALNLPQDFLSHLSKLIPYQFQHSGQQTIEQRHTHEHAYIVKLLGGKDLSQLSMAELSSLYAEAIKPPPETQLKLISANGDGN